MSPTTLRLRPLTVSRYLPGTIPRKNKNRNLATMAASSPSQTSALTTDLPLPSADAAAVVTTTPRLVYGTAWKKDRTAALVYQALKAGFRGLDTAAQPRHYAEKLVGDGVRRALAEGLLARDALFLQTKFTSLADQDPDNLPYDPAAPLPDQVHASVAASLANLAAAAAADDDGHAYLDCLVLHSPLPTLDGTLAAWRALETYVPHRIRHLGIANAPLAVLEALVAAPAVRVRPAVVQNRFYRDTAWEGPLRAFCRARGIVFQSFWTLTGNPRLLRHAVVVRLAERTGVSREAAFYALVLGLRGTTILDGTTSEEHMRADLDGLETVGRWAEGDGKQAWAEALETFKGLIGEPAE